jgi:hypothetical protein
MSMPPLNLASRPFRNERLPALLLALGFTVAGAVTIKHAVAIRGLMPGRTSGLARQVTELEDERARLRSEAGLLRAPRPEPSAVAQWTMLKELVDRRTFSWSTLFAVLEDTLPKGVRLVSIIPVVSKGERTLELTAVARTNEDLLELIRVLEDRPEFDGVLPRNRAVGAQDEQNFRLTMRYVPPTGPVAMAAANATASPAPSASPSPEAAASPAAPVAAAPAGVEGPPPSVVAEEPSPSPSPVPERPRQRARARRLL